MVEGLSGTGKSSVCAELHRRGYIVIESDEAFGFYGDPKTGLPTKERIQVNWIWDRNKVNQAIGKSLDHDVFVCGGAMNQDEFLHHFKKVFCLYVDDETLKSRLLNRTNNDFGKHPEDLARQLEWNQGTVQYAKEKGHILIDATKPLGMVVDEILNHTSRI